MRTPITLLTLVAERMDPRNAAAQFFRALGQVGVPVRAIAQGMHGRRVARLRHRASGRAREIPTQHGPALGACAGVRAPDRELVAVALHATSEPASSAKSAATGCASGSPGSSESASAS